METNDQDEEEGPVKIIKSTVNYEQQKKQNEIEYERKMNEDYKKLKEAMKKSKFNNRSFVNAS